jgi:hypothetical protein
MKPTSAPKTQSTLAQVIDFIGKILNSDEFKELAKKLDHDFTRQRKLNCVTLLGLMFNLIKTITQTAINKFIDIINPNSGYSDHATWQNCESNFFR